MTGDIIPLHSDPHEQVSLLLPWYLTDTLAPAERAVVEVHLRTCLRCQADLMAERRLRAEVAEAVAEPATADAGWQALRVQMDGQSARRKTLAPRLSRPVLRTAVRQWRASPGWMRMAMAAQLALLLLGATLLAHPWQGRLGPQQQGQTTYHALGAATVPVSANVVIMFRPDATEANLRGLLTGNGARFVDGPTAAGAYLLHVPADRRAAVLADLRTRPQVMVAEAIDPGSAP